jgi:hypothetical protein
VFFKVIAKVQINQLYLLLAHLKRVSALMSGRRDDDAVDSITMHIQCLFALALTLIAFEKKSPHHV